MLNIPAMREKQTAADRQNFTAVMPDAVMANMRVTEIAPNVWPTSRAVLCIPPALPVRWTGVARTMTILLGVWNIPNPMPQTAMRHMMSHSATLWDGSVKSNPIPVANTAIPAAAVFPGLCFSTKRAARGETSIVARGQGVISSPVVISGYPKLPISMKGIEIMVRFWAMKELTDVQILRV